jgi:hypothetical protein
MSYRVIALTINAVLVVAAGVAKIRMSVPDMSTSKLANAAAVFNCPYSVAIATVPLCVINISVILRLEPLSAVITA